MEKRERGKVKEKLTKIEKEKACDDNNSDNIQREREKNESRVSERRHLRRRKQKEKAKSEENRKKHLPETSKNRIEKAEGTPSINRRQTQGLIQLISKGTMQIKNKFHNCMRVSLQYQAMLSERQVDQSLKRKQNCWICHSTLCLVWLCNFVMLLKQDLNNYFPINFCFQ